MSKKKKVRRCLQGYPDFVGKKYFNMGFVDEKGYFIDLDDDTIDMLLDLADDMVDEYYIGLEMATQHYYLIGWEVGDNDEQ